MQHATALSIPAGVGSPHPTHVGRDVDTDPMEWTGDVLSSHIPCRFCYAFALLGALAIQASPVKGPSVLPAGAEPCPTCPPHRLQARARRARFRCISLSCSPHKTNSHTNGHDGSDRCLHITVLPRPKPAKFQQEDFKQINPPFQTDAARIRHNMVGFLITLWSVH